MCDIHKIEALLASAKIIYILAIAILGVVIINSASFFAALANIGMMVGLIATHAACTALYVAALVELDRCTGPCAVEFDALRTGLIALIAAMGIMSVLLIALAVVAFVPFAGAAAAGPVLAKFIFTGISVTGLLEFNFARAMANYNSCRQVAGLNTFSIGIIILSVLAGALCTAVAIGSVKKLGGK